MDLSEILYIDYKGNILLVANLKEGRWIDANGFIFDFNKKYKI